MGEETKIRRAEKGQCPYCRSKKIEPWFDERIWVAALTALPSGGVAADFKCNKCNKTYTLYYKQVQYVDEYDVEEEYQKVINGEYN